MAPAPSIRVIKSMTYKGGTKLWSNRYHVTGPDFSGTTEFNTFADAVTADEKASLLPAITIVEVVGYNAGSDIPAFTKTYSLAGTYAAGGSEKAGPGDSAALMRYSTTQRSVKNHPIYLFNYYHRPPIDVTGSGDTMTTTYKNQLGSYGTNWIAGYSDGDQVRKRCGPNGAVAQSKLVETYITHRDFPN